MIARRPEIPPITLHWSAVGMALAELTLIVLVGVVGWRLGGGWWLGSVFAVAALTSFLYAWGRWMAPRSRHRFDFENRQLLLVVLGSVITIAAAFDGLLLPVGITSTLLVLFHRAHYRHVTGDLREPLPARRNDM